MQQRSTQLVIYIVSIVLVNVIFLYVRTLVAENERRTVTMFYAFFAAVQLVYVVPKIIRLLKSK